jgi:hypothetical protein
VRTQLSERDHLVGQGGIAQQLRKRQAIAAQRLEESRERRRRQEPGEDRRTLDGKVLDLDRPLQRSIWAWCCRLFGDSHLAPCDPVEQVTHAQDGAKVVGTDR